jgi:hypothetical protein
VTTSRNRTESRGIEAEMTCSARGQDVERCDGCVSESKSKKDGGAARSFHSGP